MMLRSSVLSNNWLRALFVLVATFATAGLARAGGPNRHSCQKALARANEAAVAYETKAARTLVRIEIGSGAIGTKHELVREIEPGDYGAFAVGERGVISMIKLSVLDGTGKELV